MNATRKCDVSIDHQATMGVRAGSNIDFVYQGDHSLSEEHLIMTIDPHPHRNTSSGHTHLKRLHLH
jgi:hypothetical protein